MKIKHVSQIIKEIKMNIIHKIKTGIALLVLLAATVSCVDTLDQVPSDKVGIDRILNKTSIVDFRNNSYGQLPKTFTGFSSGAMLESFTDDAFRAGNSNSSFQWHSGLLSLSNSFFSKTIWDNCWKGIRRCNLAIEYLPQSEVSKQYIDDEDIQRYIDEVKTLRAWYHFILIKNFGPLPFLDQAYGPSFDGWRDLTRPSYHDISMRIVDECNEVIDNDVLDLRRNSLEENGFVTKAVAYALKSRVLLYNASTLNNASNDATKWELAAQAAQECIDALTPDYSLVDIDDYSLLFTQANNTFSNEIIYSSTTNGSGTTNNNNGIDLFEYGSKDQNGNCGAVPTQELVDCFELKDGTLPVASYTNADHTSVALNAGYSENVGDNPYLNRDARLYHSVLYNGANYGKMNGLNDSVFVFTYEGRSGSGFNRQPLNQDDAFKRLSCTGYYTRKYRSANYWGTSTGGTNAHKIFFRLAEVYLNLAEAECELGKLDKAKAALNIVRERAGQPKIENVPGYVSSADFLMSRIRNERRVELCFEGHRYYDQRRWKILERTNNAITGMKVVSDGGDNGIFTYERVKIDVARNATSDKYLVLPIIESEARRLTGLGQPEAWQ